MLVNTRIEAGKVYTFKLNSGEELIAKVDKVEAGVIELKKPMAVVGSPQGGLGLVPWVQTVDMDTTTIPLNATAYTMAVETTSNFEKEYTKITTNIALPQ